MTEAIVASSSALVGVLLGAWVTRRNDKRAATDRLLVETLNEIVGGISDSASGVPGAQARYATAMAQLALHGSPEVVRAFRQFQDLGETISNEGREILAQALFAARKELGRNAIDADDAYVLLFGSATQAMRPGRPRTTVV